MVRFLRLSQLIVNTSKIATIDILPTKYTIFMSNHHLDGWMFCGSGDVKSSNNKIEICKINNTFDYRIVEKWITSTEKKNGTI